MWQCVALYPARERGSSLFKGGCCCLFVKGKRKSFCVRNGAKLSGWIADIQSGVQSDKSGKFQ